jgi:hypothetical protein
MKMTPQRTRTATAALAMAFGICMVPVALGGTGGERIEFDDADQAAARAALVRRGDLHSKAWTGGPIKPDLSPPSTCRNYHPKQSDLVLTGAAESNFSRTFLLRAIDSEVKILKTARMVRTDWRREILAPGTLSCQRHHFAKSLPGARVVSFSRIPFPRVAPYVAAFRGVAELRTDRGKPRLLVDLVLVSHGRSEISLLASAPFAERVDVMARERRLVRTMLRRAKV